MKIPIQIIYEILGFVGFAMFAHNISGIEPRDRMSVPCAPQGYLAISGIDFHATMGKIGGIGEVY